MNAPPTLTDAHVLAATAYRESGAEADPAFGAIYKRDAEIIAYLRGKIEECSRNLNRAEATARPFLAADCRAQLALAREMALDLYPAAFAKASEVAA